MCQISAQSEHAFVFYGKFCEVCEMKMKKKTKKILFACISEMAGAIFFKFGMETPLTGWHVSSNIWFQSDMGSQSYIGVKIAFSFFLLIHSRCGAPTSWAARHTTVCLDVVAPLIH